ncbi:MAG: D-alanyl-D-alanine carboxypeptidase family protein [Anaerolineales bacterium]|nr:D-alanyl-D-alanine carboxypeptidase family protein [Anaerolineales bacterium]
MTDELVPIVPSDILIFGVPPERYPNMKLRPRIHEMLQAAADSLAPGWAIVIYSAYRPFRDQITYWNRRLIWLAREHPSWTEEELITECRRWVADPRQGSGHQAGAAVDVTLRQPSGKELDMGTAIGEFSERTPTASPGLTAEQEANRQKLLNVMHRAGFINYIDEWWHFSHGDRLWAEMTGAPESDVIYQPFFTD